ncbi:DUF4129 domain-containing protein, partial [Arthrobacter sp. SO3]|uniref:DUF4129 domain-containing protein n=1 Tax=Arthrobacter sp. SO3 TaxID=1897057 RepID=UPI001CFFBDDC
PSVAPLPLPGTAAAPADAASRILPVLSGAGALLLLGLLLASPHLARTAVRRRRLSGSGAGGAAALRAWAELRDLAMDFGVAPQGSETPRHFSARLRSSGALGEPEAMDADGHQAVRSLTADFERAQYGRPLSTPDGGGLPGGARKSPGAGAPASGAGEPAPHSIAAVRASLRAHAGPLVRFRAAWLPPSLMAAWRSAATAPFRAARRTAKRTRRGLAGARSRTRGGLRRVRWLRRS